MKLLIVSINFPVFCLYCRDHREIHFHDTHTCSTQALHSIPTEPSGVIIAIRQITT